MWGMGYGVIVVCEGREQEIGVASILKQTLCQVVVEKRKLSRKPKLSIYYSNFILTLAYGHELKLVSCTGWLGSDLEME